MTHRTRMRSGRSTRMLVLGAALQLAALQLTMAGAASAQLAANATQVGSAFAAPYVTGLVDGDVITVLVITNALSEPTTLQFHVLDGEPGGDWADRSFDCFLTANETTVLTIVGDGAGADLAVECSATNAGPGFGDKSIVTNRNLPGRRGIVFAARSQRVDSLIVDWTVIDFAAGTAWSAEALHFQGFVEEVEAEDGTFPFDNRVYSAFPSAVASNFIAPDCTDPADPTTCDVDVELLLFTLDGRPGDPPPQEARLDFYNDDERLLDNVDIPFECLEIVRLVDLDVDFNAEDLCQVAPLGCVGHFQLTPQRVDVFTGHDNPTGFGEAFDDNERLSVFHGWILHKFNQGATILNFGPIANDAATARLLLSGANSNTGLGGDTPALDTR